MDAQTELEVRKMIEEERSRNNRSYAIKLAETLIFGLCGIIIIGAITAIIKLIYK